MEFNHYSLSRLGEAATAIIACVAVASTAVHAAESAMHPFPEIKNDPQLQVRLGRHMHIVRGSLDALSIPNGIKLRNLLTSKHGANNMGSGGVGVEVRIPDRLKLSAIDSAAIVAAATTTEADSETAEAAMAKRVAGICAIAGTQPKEQVDIVGIGSQMNQAQEEYVSRLNEDYRDLLSKLSAEGQVALNDYLNQVVAPSMSYGWTDYAGLFAELPMHFAEQLSKNCQQSSNLSQAPTKQPGGSDLFAPSTRK